MGYTHNYSKVHPSLQSGIVVPKNNTPWVLGADTEIAAAGAIPNNFRIIGLLIESVSANGIYEIVLYANNTEMFRCRLATTVAAGTYSGLAEIPVVTDLFVIPSRISASIASNNAGPGSITISLRYFTH